VTVLVHIKSPTSPATRWIRSNASGNPATRNVHVTNSPTANSFARRSLPVPIWRTRRHSIVVSSRLPAKNSGEPLDFESQELDVVAVHEDLDRLARLNERQSQVITLRYFGGLTVPEVARALGVSEFTVERDWRFARAWLHGQLRGDIADDT